MDRQNPEEKISAAPSLWPAVAPWLGLAARVLVGLVFVISGTLKAAAPVEALGLEDNPRVVGLQFDNHAAARDVDSGAKDVTESSAAAKVFASDAAMKITVDAVQVCGGAGYMRDYPVEKMMRDAKILQIYEGTNQILRNAIAMNLRKRKARTA